MIIIMKNDDLMYLHNFQLKFYFCKSVIFHILIMYVTQF